ncbi:MAG: haloacid dehalogenase [Glaciihabitans sp.]|nr:haloacid dehalogenase [Glaciihabitans sp.]
MTSPRIAFLDVDGTIIDSGENIADSTIEAVQTARKNGHLVYLSTGRAEVEIYPVIREIGFDGSISAGGGFATVGDELVISRTMPEAAVARLIDFYEESGYDFYFQSYNEIFPSPGVRARFADYLDHDIHQQEELRDDIQPVARAEEHPALKAFGNVRPFSHAGIAKSVFLGKDLTAFDRAYEALNGDYHVITGTIPHLGYGTGEVSLSGVNKGSTIIDLLELLDIDVATSIGIGDSSNDVEMLQVCGVGIAMGNAIDRVKAVADDVTTAVLDDGIWNAFRRHGLI